MGLNLLHLCRYAVQSRPAYRFLFITIKRWGFRDVNLFKNGVYRLDVFPAHEHPPHRPHMQQRRPDASPAG